MICDLHNAKPKTHVCLKSNCGLQLLCIDCVQQSHSQHITLEINEFQRVIQNMIQHYDKQETLEDIDITKLQANLEQLSQLFLQIQQIKKKIFNTQPFSVVNSLLQKLQREQPSKEEVKSLQKVGNQFVFYRDSNDEWKYQLVNENKKLLLIEELLDQIKQFSTQLQDKIDLLTTSIFDLCQLILQQEETLQELSVINKTDKPKCRRGRPPNSINSKSLYLQKLTENQDMSIEDPVNSIQVYDESLNYQNKQQSNQHEPEEQITERQPSPIIKQSLLDLYYNLEDCSEESNSPTLHQEQINESQNESRRQPMRVQIIKEKMRSEKRKYQKKAYSRFKFNTNLCLNIHEQIFG